MERLTTKKNVELMNLFWTTAGIPPGGGEISQIPFQYWLNFELNDGALPGNPLHDPSRLRRFCGEGDFDIKGLIACANKMGYAGPWAVEVFSEELAGLSLEELNRRAFTTTMAQLKIDCLL